jgi:undecaprenyl-diphosphatase
MPLSRDDKAAATCLLVFTIISVLMLTGITGAWDGRVLQNVASWRTPAMTTLMRAMSWIGNGQVEVPLVLLVSGLLWRGGRGPSAWRYLALAGSCEILWAAAKLLFHRPRPAIVTRLSDAGWYSYPSGHAMLAPVIWGFGLILLAELVAAPAAKRTCWTLAVAMPIAIALSRLYLGVHYPTDLLAGLFLGTAWVLEWRVRVSAAAETARTR